SLGTLIALWRDKTFQALALTVLFMVLYFCLVHALSLLPWISGGSITAGEIARLQSWLEPLLALQAVVEPRAEAALAPAYGFALHMLGLSVLLNMIAMWRLRVWNPSGEPIMQREAPEENRTDLQSVPEFGRTESPSSAPAHARVHAAPGAVRPVWRNPILW